MSSGTLIASRYRVLREIGRGGHSIVYRAEDSEGGADVAIKVLNDVAAASPELAVRLVREHRVMTDLAGTSAVRAIALASAPTGAMCLVMELLEGPDLDHHLEAIEASGGRIGVMRTLEILDPVVSTLQTAHELGIVHRDLKPGNVIVLDAGGGVRLIDFGLARVRSAQPITRDGMIMGSPSYIAPEMWLGRPALVDRRADVYSLGAIVFRALAGRVPFPADTIPGKLELATTAPRPSLHELRPELPPSVDDWVRQTLAIEPEARFRRIDAAWSALRVALGLGPRSNAL